MSHTLVKEKNAAAKALFAKARAVLENPEAEAEEKEQVQKYIDDAKKLQGEAAQLQDIMKHADAIVEREEDKQPDEDAKGKRKSATEFADWAEYLKSVWRANHPSIKAAPDPRLQGFKDKDEEAADEKKDMAENVGATGGFLVPAEFLNQLQAVMAEDSLVRSRATVIRMRRRQINVPVLDQTTTTAGIPHWFGGMQFYWAEEASEKTEDDPNFRQAVLTAHKLIGYTRASDELVDDAAISISDFLSGPLGMSGGISWMEDYAFIRGTGAGQPLGVVNAGATITVNRAAQNTAGLVDLLNMLENFLPSGRGTWFYTQSALRELMEISGPAGNASYVFMPSAREGVPDTIFGYPAVRTEKCPRIGTAGDFILGDWRYYMIGDRQATTIESTKFDRWRYDQTSWRAVHRVDGQPWLSAPLTYEDGTTQVSPFVILGDKST